MTKSKTRTSIVSRRKAAQDKSSFTSKPSLPVTSPAPTKQARIITMLQSPAGTTIDAVMKETGWQQHSVRGFFAGVVRRKLKLNLVSEQSDNGRIYRIRESRLKARLARAKRAT